MQFVEGDTVEVNGSEAWNCKVQSSTDNMLVLESGEKLLKLSPIKNKENYYYDGNGSCFIVKKYS